MISPARRATLGACLVLLGALVAVVATNPPAQTTGDAGTRAVPYLQQDSGYVPRPEDGRPNIVVILTDDMRADDLQWMPATRRLLGPRAGRAFAGAISPHPLCCPARAELVTGQYAQNNGVQFNSGPYGGFSAMRSPADTIGAWLERSGYATSWHGKYMNNYGESNRAQEGWTEWDPLVKGEYNYREWRFWGDRQDSTGYITHELTARSTGTVARFAGPGSPFFMVVNHTAPHYRLVRGTGDELRTHQPPVAERKYANRYADLQAPAVGTRSFNAPPVFRDTKPQTVAKVNLHFRQRLRALRSVDDSVAATLSALARSGELDNTYVVFTSDNGYQLGEHRYLTKNVLYRESLDIPLLVRGPGVVPGVSRPTVTLVDLPATLLDIAGVTPGRVQDGRSLVPFLRGRANPAWRTSTLVQVGSSARGPVQPGWDARGVQTKRYLYYEWVNHPGDPRAYILFDRRRDPRELDNVARDPRYRAVVRRLSQQVRRLETCSGARCNVRFARLPAPGR